MFDYIQFPSFTHTTGMTHFLDININAMNMQNSVFLAVKIGGTNDIVKEED